MNYAYMTSYDTSSYEYDIRRKSNFHFVAEESMNFLLAICFKDKTAKSQKSPCVFIPNGYIVGDIERSPLV